MAAQFDIEANQEVYDTINDFSEAVVALYNEVSETLGYCDDARPPVSMAEGTVDARQVSFNIVEADRNAFETLDRNLSEVSRTEALASAIWIEFYAMNRRGAEMDKEMFKWINESFTDDRLDINEAIDLFNGQSEELTPPFVYKDASQGVLKKYRDDQAALIAEEPDAKQSGLRERQVLGLRPYVSRRSRQQG